MGCTLSSASNFSLLHCIFFERKRLVTIQINLFSISGLCIHSIHQTCNRGILAFKKHKIGSNVFSNLTWSYMSWRKSFISILIVAVFFNSIASKNWGRDLIFIFIYVPIYRFAYVYFSYFKYVENILFSIIWYYYFGIIQRVYKLAQKLHEATLFVVFWIENPRVLKCCMTLGVFLETT